MADRTGRLKRRLNQIERIHYGLPSKSNASGVMKQETRSKQEKERERQRKQQQKRERRLSVEEPRKKLIPLSINLCRVE